MNKEKHGSLLFWIVGLLLFLVIGYFFLFSPNKIFGGDVGSYKKGDTVLSFVNIGIIPIQNHKVVIVKNSNGFGDLIGYIEGVPGDKIENAYYLSKEKYIGERVPSGYYAIKYYNNTFLRLVPKSDIKSIVWFPFK